MKKQTLTKRERAKFQARYAARARIKRERDLTLRALERQLEAVTERVDCVASAGATCGCGCGVPVSEDRGALLASYQLAQERVRQQIADATELFASRLAACDEDDRRALTASVAWRRQLKTWRPGVDGKLTKPAVTKRAAKATTTEPSALAAAASKPQQKAGLYPVGEAAALAEARRVMDAAPPGVLVAAPILEWGDADPVIVVDARTGLVTGTEWRRHGS
jgi:hypothetical protein